MNMQKLMAQAQQMQKSINQKKDKIESMEFKASNEFVDVIVNGKKELKNVIVKMESLDKDDIEVLQDMICLAINDANKQVDKEFEKEMGAYGQSLNGLF
ncbi:MAG: YbaB/EbfC family nucleoid-associated protein [Bacilli bacterium]|nr:YbaB/EbfC family nucleoid-associated protein [Bacilli bacterium]